jgi:hypothetical protein
LESIREANGGINGYLRIYGISDDDKIFYSTIIHISINFYIYDLKSNEIVSWWNYYTFDLNKINSIASEYNIKLINEYVSIEKFPINFTNAIYELKSEYIAFGHDRYEEFGIESNVWRVYSCYTFYFIKNSKKTTIELGKKIAQKYGTIYGTDFVFFRNPFNENRIVIIIINSVEYGGNYEYGLNEYLLFGFDLDQL